MALDIRTLTSPDELPDWLRARVRRLPAHPGGHRRGGRRPEPGHRTDAYAGRVRRRPLRRHVPYDTAAADRPGRREPAVLRGHERHRLPHPPPPRTAHADDGPGPRRREGARRRLLVADRRRVPDLRPVRLRPRRLDRGVGGRGRPFRAGPPALRPRRRRAVSTSSGAEDVCAGSARRCTSGTAHSPTGRESSTARALVAGAHRRTALPRRRVRPRPSTRSTGTPTASRRASLVHRAGAAGTASCRRTPPRCSR